MEINGASPSPTASPNPSPEEKPIPSGGAAPTGKTAAKLSGIGNRRTISAAVVALALMMATAWWLFRRKVPLGRDGWFLVPHPQPWPLAAWALPGAVLLLLGSLAGLSAYDRCFRARTPAAQKLSLRMAVGALMMLSMGWNWSLLGPGGTLTDARNTSYNGTYSIVANAFSDIATQYLGAAYQIDDARQWTRDFHRRQQPSSPQLAHVATHPPGPVLLFYGCRRLLENIPVLRVFCDELTQRTIGHTPAEVAASANDSRRAAFNSAGVAVEAPLPVEAVAVAMLAAVVFSAAIALSVPAVFMLARDAIAGGDSSLPDGDARRDVRGLLGASLWVLAPMTALFGFTLDALVAGGAAWTLALAGRGLGSSKASAMIAAGAMWGLTVYFSFGALAVGVIVALWALARGARDGSGLRQMVQVVARLAIGAGAMWIVLVLLFPMQPITILQNAMAAHRAATLQSRAYWPWLPLNFAFWALFAGWPLLVAAIATPRRHFDFLTRYALPMATLGTMILISVLGSVRGETERLWLFLLAPCCALGAAFWGDDLKLRSSLWLLWPVAQAAQTLMMASALAPLAQPL